MEGYTSANRTRTPNVQSGGGGTGVLISGDVDFKSVVRRTEDEI